ncbi:type VI secretion system tip protein TssI/VgrG [Polyangium sp. 15x6]|uniref:type VI secretion system Vgr family protein n=1 Tax=Polyangium sp. 15x6 TaxID=3042687 RepID=UPI00249CB6E6|nr:type VI secretion system tip protein TssI/VgrG [Polyangium sp. 15x6]MDI3290152.1 type VI secretion system tip protein TssI/VgrG [Polyangium sp. 15x6]
MPSFDYTFACEEAIGADPWASLRVARFRGTEALSSLYRYEILLLDPAGTIAVPALVGKRATLRIATLSAPVFKTVHGIVVEAEEISRLPEGRTLRVVLAPPFARALHRRRCRIFLDRTLREIVSAVLLGDPLVREAGAEAPAPDLGDAGFAPAKEAFAWRVEDTSRLDNRRVRPFVVQYNESDFAFVSRLLEEEGITYHVENGAETSLLVFSDGDAGRPRLLPDLVGIGIDGREIRGVFTGGRMRPEAVSLGEYNWKQPGLEMAAWAGGKDADLFEVVYPGGYPDESSQGKPLAKARLERHRTEARFARGEGHLRVLGAGTIFKLEHKKPRLEGEYLVTSLEVVAEQAGVLPSGADGGASEPFLARFECARRGQGTSIEESGFRPPRVTPRPRIVGTQTAIVTADPSSSGAEIHIGGPAGAQIGCVRLRFHWDTDEARLAKEPSSAWVRVSEPFAGSGMGGVWHPRVGTEVIVDFEEGDPDRPLVVGRVYNGKNRPYHGGAPTVSTLKSNASPGGAVHNEITFDDTSGAERIYTNAGKDMETDVGNERTETVGANSAMKVGANDTETIGANCSVTIGGDETVTVAGNDTALIGGNVSTTIGANAMTVIGGNEGHFVGADQTITIAAAHSELVGGGVTEEIGGTLTTSVAASETESVGGNRTTTITGAHTQSFGAAHLKMVGGNRDLSCASLDTTVSAASIRIVAGSVTTKVAADHTLTTGGGAIYLAPRYKALDANRSDVDVAKYTITGLDVTIGGIALGATGYSSSTMGVSAAAAGLNVEFVGADVDFFGLLTRVDGGHMQNNGVKTRVGLIIKL